MPVLMPTFDANGVQINPTQQQIDDAHRGEQDAMNAVLEVRRLHQPRDMDTGGSMLPPDVGITGTTKPLAMDSLPPGAERVAAPYLRTRMIRRPQRRYWFAQPDVGIAPAPQPISPVQPTSIPTPSLPAQSPTGIMLGGARVAGDAGTLNGQRVVRNPATGNLEYAPASAGMDIPPEIKGTWMQDYWTQGSDAAAAGLPPDFTDIDPRTGYQYINGHLFHGQGMTDSGDKSVRGKAYNDQLTQYAKPLSTFTRLPASMSGGTALALPAPGTGSTNPAARASTLNMGTARAPGAPAATSTNPAARGAGLGTTPSGNVGIGVDDTNAIARPKPLPTYTPNPAIRGANGGNLAARPAAANVGIGGGSTNLLVRTQQFKDGGRVGRRRAPITIEHGYAEGGTVGPQFQLTYQDYLQQGKQRGSDGAPLFSEAQWNALDPRAQWEAMGGEFNLTKSDPRYAAFASATHPEAGRDIRVYGTQNFQRDKFNKLVNDPKRVAEGDGFVATPWDNHTPQAQAVPDDAERSFLAGAGLLLGAGLGANAAFGWNGGAGLLGGAPGGYPAMEGPGAFDAGGSAGIFDSYGNPVTGAFSGAEPAAGAFEAGYPGGDVGIGTGSDAGAFESGYPGNAPITPEQLAKDPSLLERAAKYMGQSVESLLSNPKALAAAARFAGLFAGRNATAQHIPQAGGDGNGASGNDAPGNGGGAPGTGPGSFNATPPAGSTSRTASYNPNPSNIDVNGLLDSLNPDNFKGKPASFDRWDATRAQFQPITSLLLNDAATAGSAQQQEAEAGRAGADVAQSFAASEDARRRRMIAQGVNPDDARGTGFEADRLAALDAAKAAAGAKNSARLAEKNRGLAVRSGVAQLGHAQAGQALSADQIGINTDLADRKLAADLAQQRTNLGLRTSDNAADREARKYQVDTNADLTRERLGQDLATSNADRNLRRYQTDQGTATQRYGIDTSARTAANRLNYDVNNTNYGRDRQAKQDTGAGITRTIKGIKDIYDLGDDAGWWSDLGDALGFKDGGPIDIGIESDADMGPERERDMPMMSRAEMEKMMRGRKSLRTHGGRVRRRNYDAGGPVEGPGTSTSDSIHARLSDGEHVVNAEGTELAEETNPGYLDQLNEAGRRIRAVREAMRRKLAAANDIGIGG